MNNEKQPLNDIPKSERLRGSIQIGIQEEDMSHLKQKKDKLMKIEKLFIREGPIKKILKINIKCKYIQNNGISEPIIVNSQIPKPKYLDQAVLRKW